jgi:phage gp29-like protein
MRIQNTINRAGEWLREKLGAPAARGSVLANRVVQPVSLQVHVKAANRWRNAYNPLRGLTIERAVALLEAGERGEYADLQWLYRFIEKRDATLCALLSRYDGGLLKLDWEIKEVTGDGKSPLTPALSPGGGEGVKLAGAQAAALRQAYEGLDNLRQALQFLVTARFRGFAHLEKWQEPSGEVVHLEPVPQWYWVREGLNGAWEYQREARSGARRGQPIDLGRFIVREVERPVDELALFIHVRRNLCQKDWDAFVETYGVPAMFVIGPAGADPELEERLAAQVEEVIGNYRGYFPYGTQLATVPMIARGVNPFRTYLKALDEALVLAATGGKLSVLSEPGVGQQAGFVHWQVWREIIQAEAMLISEVMQRQFDAPVLARQFPGQPALAYFELCAKEETDVAAVVEQAATLAKAGYRVEPGQLSEKTGYRLVEG